jgi:hypothetical protein
MPNLCSYCHNPGHNIKTCNDNELLSFHIFILNEKILNYQNPSIFREILQMQPLKKLWGYAVKYCNLSVRNNNKEENIQAIFIKYYSYTLPMLQYKLDAINPIIPVNSINQDQEIEEDLEDFDLLSVSTYNSSNNEEDELEITWYIDRIGSGTNTKNTIQDFPITILNNNPLILEEKECNICYEIYNIQKFIKLQCNHEFCHNCIENQFKNNKFSKIKINCAYCREPFKHLFINSSLI